MHSTDDLNDGYKGSGSILSLSIKKYGRENHICEILEHLPSRETLRCRERSIVNEEILDDRLCMNLRLGGEGWESEEASLAAVKGNQSSKRWTDEYRYKRSEISKERHSQGRFSHVNHATFTGKTHSVEVRQKIGEDSSKNQLGCRNSQFGTMWITNELESIKIKKDQTIPLGWRLGRKLKRV